MPQNYAFVGENGPVSFPGLFGDKQTLAAYSYMYGPKRALPCPMCTSLMAAWDGESLDVEQRIALVMVARSPSMELPHVHGRFRFRLFWCGADPLQDSPRGLSVDNSRQECSRRGL